MFQGPDGAAIEVTTRTLPPGPQYARLEGFGSIDDAAEAVIEGTVLSKERHRFGEIDAFVFESSTGDQRGITVCTLKKDRNFANHLIVVSGHAPVSSWEAAEPAISSAISSLTFRDDVGQVSDAELQPVKPML